VLLIKPNGELRPMPLSPKDARDAHDLARDFLMALLIGNGANNEALSKTEGRDASTVRRWRRKGEKWAANEPLLAALLESPAKSPKGGEEEMNATMVAEVIERLERLQEDVRDIKQSSHRIEFRQLDAEEDSSAVESQDD